MSLSREPDKMGFVSGRVFMGVDTPGPGQTTIQELEGKKKLVWDEEVSVELIARTREKAQALARDLLAKAHDEADTLKRQASEEGLNLGLAQAEEQVNAHVTALTEQVGAALAEVKAQASRVFAAQRRDFVALIRLAVEKAVAVEMDERRTEILEKLLAEALELIESRRGITVKVCPDDQPVMAELVELARQKRPELSSVTIKADAALTGGLILECDEGMVDNTDQGRFSQVLAVFDQLAASGETGNGVTDEQSGTSQEPAGE